MVVDRSPLREESGQSIIEFLLLLPVMVGLTVVLLRINMAIQTSIVNQQYARAQALFLTQNSSVYPRLEQRLQHFAGDQLKTNRMVIGVSENAFPNGGATKPPEPPIQLIARSKQKAGSKGSGEANPRQRLYVRVHTTVELCTQSNVAQLGNGMSSVIGAMLPERGFSPTSFKYCWSPSDE